MKIGTEDKKKLGIAAVLGVCALFAAYYLYDTFFGGPSTPPPPVAPVVITRPSPGGGRTGGTSGSTPGGTPIKLATRNGQLDPTLHMGPMVATESLVYSGSGRNIFGANSEPAAVAKLVATKFPPRPATTEPTHTQAYVPPTPPIDLKFFGLATRMGVRRALLLSGDDVLLASPGDIVQRRYRIVSISASSITVEDMPNSTRQTLPLVAN